MSSMNFTERFEHLRTWSTTVNIANALNKHDIYFRDMYPYESNPPDYYKPPSLYPIISRPLVGQTGWDCYKPENINGYQIHYLQVIKPTFAPVESFETYLSKQKVTFELLDTK